MIKLGHIIAVRNFPTAEIRETACPVGEMTARVAQLQKSWDTVFVSRIFNATERAP